MKRLLLCYLILLPAMAFSQDFLDQFPFRQQTQYFDFRCKRNSPQIPEIARFADGFIKLVNHDFFKAQFDYPIRVLVLEDRARFKEFLVRELHISDPPNFGIYLPRYKLFATYEDSGWGTFTHEILHPLVEGNLQHRPLWALEGIPTFFEKFYGYWKGNDLVVYWGFQNPWRIEQLGTNLTRLDLRKVISDPEPSNGFTAIERQESSWRMGSMFLWEQGRFNRFLQLIATHNKAGYPTYFEAAMEMPLEKILPLWQTYLNQAAAQRAKILLLPNSKILPDEAAFQSFVKANYLSLEQPKQQN
ncbi:MAG: hypothetical protein JWR69_331 [Pedosphaera sp.]|nr:hypothetical protein [Pedosphaera sp.]